MLLLEHGKSIMSVLDVLKGGNCSLPTASIPTHSQANRVTRSGLMRKRGLVHILHSYLKKDELFLAMVFKDNDEKIMAQCWYWISERFFLLLLYTILF